MSASDAVILESGDTVRTITLNRPAKLNSFDVAMWLAFAEALERADGDDEVAVILISANGRGFCAGQDLAAMSEVVGYDGTPPPERVMRILLRLSKPTIAAVQGVAAGFGMALAVLADLLVIGEHARFIAPFVSIGLGPDGALSTVLVERIGWYRAARMLYTGNPVDAPTLVEWGFAEEITPTDRVLADAVALGEQVAAGGRPALHATKSMMSAGRVDGWEAALAREIDALERLAHSDEHRRAVEQFLGA